MSFAIGRSVEEEDGFIGRTIDRTYIRSELTHFAARAHVGWTAVRTTHMVGPCSIPAVVARPVGDLRRAVRGPVVRLALA